MTYGISLIILDTIIIIIIVTCRVFAIDSVVRISDVVSQTVAVFVNDHLPGQAHSCNGGRIPANSLSSCVHTFPRLVKVSSYTFNKVDLPVLVH